jgi:hypothetical protein
MGTDLAHESQDSSLPPRRFASTQFRTTATPAQSRRCGRLCALIALVLALQTLSAQQLPTPATTASPLKSRLGDSRAATTRTHNFLTQRATLHNESPATALLRARAQHLALAQQQRAHPHTANLTAAWQPLGPSSIVSATFANLTGRITAIAPDPNDATGNTVYIGTTGGGVWKSTNAAGPLADVTFAPLTDTLPAFSANASSGVIPSLSIGALAVQPSLEPVLLAGTGDPNDATDSYYGEGLLRSTDAGFTWTLIQTSHDFNGNHSFLGLATAALAFSTATPALVVAAFSTSPQSAIVGAATDASVPGLYFSTDAGLTWQMATLYDGTTVVQNPQPLGTNAIGNAVTAVVWDPIRVQFFAAVRAHGYYASPDGATWTRLLTQPGTALTTADCPVGPNGLGGATCPIFRGALAVQPATGDLYALTVDLNDTDQGLWQDLCNATANTCATPAPTFPNRIDNAALDTGPTTPEILQGAYDLALAAIPAPPPAAANSTLLFAGTVDLYRCSLAFNSSVCTLRNTTNALDGCNAPAAVAPAQHAIAASPSSPLLFLSNDGGLWRSLDGVAETGSVCSSTDASHFDNLNPAIGAGGSLAEVIGFAQDPATADTLIAGLGTLGSAATSTASTLTPWPQLSVGEGGYPSIDPTTPTDWYISIGAGVNLASCTLGANCTPADFDPPATIGEPQVSDEAALLDAPTLLDPAFTTNLLLGTCRIWRGSASDASAWSSANAISPAFDGTSTPCTPLSALVRSIAAGGPTATSVDLQNSGSTVLYAGLAGLLDGGGVIPGHLFVTITANLPIPTWTDAALSPVTNDPAATLFNPGNFDISSITVDPHDLTGATVYATIMGFDVPHLYRSADFGAHWLNLSANLPNAPANALAVDPNDANTVYLALDTGVYVTQAITACPTTNCWSVLGTALPNSPIIALAAAPGLPTGDDRRGLIRAATYGRGLWQTPLLTAISLAQPAISLSAASFTFAPQQVATQSPAQTLTITSTGNAPVTFGTPAITGDFSETDDCANQTIAVNSTCTVQITFAPTVTGPRSGQLTLYANISGGQAIVLLTGTGTAPAAIILDPLSLTFAATIVNQATPAQDITISNTGGNPATLETPIITGDSTDFALTANTCGATLIASTGCTVSIAFTPTASGVRSATFSIADSTGTQSATLTGTGNSPATDTLSPTSLTFAQQTIGTTSTAQQITLSNAGDVALTLIAASVSPGDFAVTNACGNSLAAHSTCAFNVTFAPTASGARSATLTIADQFRSQTVALTGIGIAPPGVSLSPASLTFPATGVGLTTLPQTLTLTNNGGLALTIASIAASPNFTIAANTCTATLAPNAACTFTIVFTPTNAGPFSGTITLTDNATPTTQAAILAGTGIDFTLASNGPTTVTLSGKGATGAYPMLLSSLPTLTGNVALSCTGIPANATCTVVPSIASLGDTSTIAVTVETGVSTPPPTAASSRRFNVVVLLALLLPLPLRKKYRRTPRLATLALLLTLATTLSGCGADRTIPASTITPITSTPTPAGTYPLTISASAAGLTHTVTVSLIVQ